MFCSIRIPTNSALVAIRHVDDHAIRSVPISPCVPWQRVCETALQGRLSGSLCDDVTNSFRRDDDSSTVKAPPMWGRQLSTVPPLSPLDDGSAGSDSAAGTRTRPPPRSTTPATDGAAASTVWLRIQQLEAMARSSAPAPSKKHLPGGRLSTVSHADSWTSDSLLRGSVTPEDGSLRFPAHLCSSGERGGVSSSVLSADACREQGGSTVESLSADAAFLPMMAPAGCMDGRQARRALLQPPAS